ncbi:unnamed protein product [Closterium sp. NIES-65]|nr:unnamed protein product [Closterium sp. NIES-65]
MARGTGALEELAGAVEAAVEAGEGVGVAVGVVAGVEVSLAAVEAEAEVVAEVAAVEEVVAEEVELVWVALRKEPAPVVVCASSSSNSALLTSPPLSSSVSGTLHVNGCFLPDPGIETAALGTGEAAALGASKAAALGARAFAPSAAGESALSGTAPTCVPCVKGRQRAAPHFSQFPPTEAPLQTLHMDVWGPARVRGQGHERYFLLVVDDYSRYTTVFPLRSKGDVIAVLIEWIRAAHLQLRQSFGLEFPVLRLHSHRGGEFSSGLQRAYYRARGIRQTFTLPDSPQKNGIAECRIGIVMDVARTSMIHAAAPHFLRTLVVRYAAHQMNLHPRVSMPETFPSLLWTGKVGDASAFRVWESRAFDRDLSADKLSHRAAPCVFLGFPPEAPGWQFYHPTSRRVLSSEDNRFDESVPYYRLFPYRTPSLPPPPLFLVPGPPLVDPLPPQGTAPSGVSRVDAVKPVKVTGHSCAAKGAELGVANSGGAERVGAAPGGAEPAGANTGGVEPGGVATGGAELAGVEPGGATPGGSEPGGATPGGAEPGGAEPEGVGPTRVASGSAGPGGSPGASSRREPLSQQGLREWFARRWRRAAGAGGSPTAEGAGAAGPGGARAGCTGAAGLAGATGAGAAEVVGAEATAVDPGGGLAGGTTGAAGGTGAGGAPGAGAAAGGAGVVPAPSPP